MTIKEQRIHFFNYIYQSILFEHATSQIKVDAFEKENFSGEWLRVIETLGDNLNKYEEKIVSHLKTGWTLERLSNVDKALLFCALSERETKKDLDRKIIIHEYVNLAKEFGSQDSTYRLINALLEKLV